MVTAPRATRVADAFLGERGVGVHLSEVLARDLRFEASAYALDARHAVAELQQNGHRLIPLYGPSGLAPKAHNAFRFRRIFVDADHGVPFLSSSDIIEVRPERDAFLSRKIQARLGDLLIEPWQVLLSCSGTIGNVALASPRVAGWALSQDAIRITCDAKEIAGYVAAFLRSRWGRPQVQGLTYGSVVQHIEPHHLESVLIPALPGADIEAIGRTCLDAALKRDEANALLDQAETVLIDALGLPPLPQQEHGPLIGRLRQRVLAGRFDASYHSPTARWIEKRLSNLKLPVKLLGDPDISLEIRAVTKFRKRVYVPQRGIPLLSSKQLFQIDPVEVKYLARGAHEQDLEEIALAHNMIVITCSGTIGRVQIIPRYMSGWAANQHALRVSAPNGGDAGYLYAWLSSVYGAVLLRRFSYGSVILELDRFQLARVPVPWPAPNDREKISQLVLRANELRDEAWRLEHQGLKALEVTILGKGGR